MTLISLRIFRKIWATREIFFGQMVYPPPPPSLAKHFPYAYDFFHEIRLQW